MKFSREAVELLDKVGSVTVRRARIALLALCAAILAVNPSQAVCLDFNVTPDYPAGDSPLSIASGDFNTDGIFDLAFADYSASTIGILLGNRDGTFTASYTVYALGGQPTAIVAGDFNRDGKADLAVAHLSGYLFGSGVFILLSYGDGTFTVPVHYPVAGVPQAVDVGDFDRDGALDVAVASYVSGQPGNVSILRGNGDGTLGVVTSYAVGNAPVALTVDDFNRDAKPDVAVANSTSSTVSILLGNGDGTLAGATSHGVGSNPESITAGDLDANGTVDLVVGNIASQNVSVLLGSGTGVFAAAVNYDVGAAAHSVAIGDFDLDGHRDVSVVTGVTAGTGLLIMPGNGDGTLGSQVGFNTGANPPTAVKTGDFNRDGKPDLATANSTANTASVFLNSSTCALNCGVYSQPSSYAAGTAPGALVVRDFDVNGTLDVAATNAVSNDVSLLLGAGDGTLSAATNYAAGTSPSSLAAADFDRDGKIDLVSSNSDSNDVSVLIGNGDGTFGPAVTYSAGTTPKFVVTADFNRDGRSDLAVANSGSDNISILIGDGTGGFSAATDYSTGTSPVAITANDFDRDGKIDVAVANSGSANISVFLGIGDGTFNAPVIYGAGVSPSAIAAGDLDHDGRLDLAAANAGSDAVSILLGNSGGTFASAVNYATGSQPRSLMVLDVNGDGKQDVVASNSGGTDITILLGAGDGSLQPPSTVPAQNAPTGLAIGDFNSDGKPDLLAANSGSNTVSVVINTCSPPDLTITKVHAGDFKEGQVGATYTITVTNSGAGRVTGLVSVTDVLPAGLTGTAISGTGWSCGLDTLTCTRSDELLPSSSYEDIIVTVNVGFNVPTVLTNTALVEATGESDTTNNTAQDDTTVLEVPDLVLTKSHDGNFAQGQGGRIYSIVVENVGAASTNEPVTVTDNLPPGLSAVGFGGTGWACDIGTLTCTRNDVLAAGSSYPPLTLIVDVAVDAASAVINTATVAGGGETYTVNNNAEDPTTILVAPSGLVARAISQTQVSLTWNAVGGATRYHVLRSSNDGPAVIVAFPVTNSYIDVSLTPGTTYVYQVRATDDSNIGPTSAPDIATTILFTDDPLIARTTVVKAAHFTELQTAANALRLSSGLTPTTFTAIAVRTVIKATHVLELRDSIAEARAALNLPPITFTDVNLAARSLIKAVHIRELRAAVE